MNNSKGTDATEDDDFGDFEGPEDEAPESVQAIAGPPNWVFPDLLRVQSNQTPLENTQSSSSTPNVSRIAVRQSESSIGGAIGRETGAIPKQRALDPPDVSLLTNASQPKLPSTLDLCSSTLRSGSYSRESVSIPSVISVSQSATSPLSRANNILMSSDASTSHTNGGADPSQTRMAQLERDLKALQTQKAVLQQQLLQKDTQIRELNSQSRQSVPNLIPNQSHDLAITTLCESFEKFRAKVEDSLKRLEDKLVSLESSLPNLITSAVESSVSLSPTDLNNGPQTESSAYNRSFINIIEQQKKELDNERKQYLVLFSDVLKNAAESIQTHINVNGPKPSSQ